MYVSLTSIAHKPVFGLSSVINVFVRFGGCLSILPRFQPAAVLEAIEADRCSVIGGVPTMLHARAR
jgi:long-chain acyl-CoA synthetase